MDLESRKAAAQLPPTRTAPETPSPTFAIPLSGSDLLLRALAFMAAAEGRDLVIPVEALQQAISAESGVRLEVGLDQGRVVVKHFFGSDAGHMADTLRSLLRPALPKRGPRGVH